MLQRYLLTWLILSSLVAFYWPTWFPDLFDPFGAAKPFLPHLFAATMFAIGCLVPRDEIRQVVTRWPTVLGGTAIQYTLMPLLAYAVGHLFRLQDDLFLGVILVGCVPGAMASNVLTLAARGNVSYSVSLTTLATLLSPLIVPIVLFIALDQSQVDRALLARKAFVVLATQVVGPVVTGHLLSRCFHRLERVMQRFGPTIANLTILTIVAVVVNANHRHLAETGSQLMFVLLAVNLVGYAGGTLGAVALRLPPGMRRALTLEIGMQNAGLGAVMAQQLFTDRGLVALPPALYTFGCMLTGTILAQIWARRQKNESEIGTTIEEPGD